MPPIKEKIAEKTREYNDLYQRYAPEFERGHFGEWVALCPGSAPIFGADEEIVRKAAARQFGKGNFALWRVGYLAFATPPRRGPWPSAR